MLGNLTGIEGNLFNEFRRVEREMNDLFGSWPWPASIRAGGRGAYPPVNVGTTPDRVDVYVFAAGLDPQTVDVSIQQNVLTIAGSRKTEEKKNGSYHVRERIGGQFRRVLNLPEDVDPEKVQATYHDGILHIGIHRREAVKPRKIQVK